MTEGIFLILGSNLGDKLSHLERAAIETRYKIGEIVKKSSVYETAAWGKIDQPSFYNQVVKIETSLSPMELLSMCLDIENNMGRVRKEKWGSRTIDIDILYYNNITLVTAQLQIPHNGIPNRKFTLIPMCEIAENFLHPTLGQTQRELLTKCTDNLVVTKLDALNR